MNPPRMERLNLQCRDPPPNKSAAATSGLPLKKNTLLRLLAGQPHQGITPLASAQPLPGVPSAWAAEDKSLPQVCLLPFSMCYHGPHTDMLDLSCLQWSVPSLNERASANFSGQETGVILLSYSTWLLVFFAESHPCLPRELMVFVALLCCPVSLLLLDGWQQQAC